MNTLYNLKLCNLDKRVKIVVVVVVVFSFGGGKEVVFSFVQKKQKCKSLARGSNFLSVDNSNLLNRVFSFARSMTFFLSQNKRKLFNKNRVQFPED